MFKSTTYKFIFDKPVPFKRVYNFLTPSAPSNNFWLVYESFEDYIAATKSETKNTLVRTLDISLSGFMGGVRYYNITLKGDNTDCFYISKNNIVEFLKLFGLK